MFENVDSKTWVVFFEVIHFFLLLHAFDIFLQNSKINNLPFFLLLQQAALISIFEDTQYISL